MANQLKEKQKKLKKLRTRNIILNLVCICLAGSGLWWTATYFWRYVNYEVTNDAFVDQYVAPLNVRASGYIKEVCFKEHQYVRQGDTLLVLDNREYQIKVKEAEAALLDAHGSQEVLHSGIETAHTNIAVQDAGQRVRQIRHRSPLRDETPNFAPVFRDDDFLTVQNQIQVASKIILQFRCSSSCSNHKGTSLF